MKLQILYCALAILFTQCYGSKILFLVPFPGPSHFVFIGKFIAELVARGHHVTSITNFPLKENVAISNYTELLIEPTCDLSGHVSQDGSVMTNNFQYLFQLWDMGVETSEHGLANKVVKNLIERDDFHFDLIISEQFFQESWLMFAHKYKAPIITIGTYGYSDFFDSIMGLQTPWSHVPHMLFSYGDQMTYAQRFYNTIFSMADVVLRRFYYMPKQNAIARKHFAALEKNGPLPTVEELEKSISIMLLNSHRSIASPRPSMPGHIDIAGANVRPPKPLPNDIQTFLDNAKDGVIYFSFGAYLACDKFPKKVVKGFTQAFGKLKQKVIWKCNPEHIKNIPANVLMRNWLPQTDILAHKNIRLFISHGGLFGTIEGIHRGVPMLFIPIFGDQFRNAAKAQAAGFALTINLKDVSNETVSEKINEIISNKTYHKRAKELSTILRDNPVDPMEEAMFWIEYVIRHKGAKHLKSSAVNQSFYEYFLWDVFGAILLAIFLVLFIVKKFFNLLFAKKDKVKIKFN